MPFLHISALEKKEADCNLQYGWRASENTGIIQLTIFNLISICFAGLFKFYATEHEVISILVQNACKMLLKQVAKMKIELRDNRWVVF